MKEGKGSSVEGGWSKSGRAVAGDDEGPLLPKGVIGVGGGRSRWQALGDNASLGLLPPGGERLEEAPFLLENDRLRCDGELDRSDEDEDFLLTAEGGAARVFDLTGTVRRVSFGTRRSAEEVSILRRFGMLVFRGFAWCGNTEEEGEGDGV